MWVRQLGELHSLSLLLQLLLLTALVFLASLLLIRLCLFIAYHRTLEGNYRHLYLETPTHSCCSYLAQVNENNPHTDLILSLI